MRLDLPTELLPYEAGGFETPDGKAMLFSQALADAGHDPLPDYRPAAEGPGGELHKKYPLVLLTPKNHTRFLNSSYSKHHGDREGGPFFEIDPADAGHARNRRGRHREDLERSQRVEVAGPARAPGCDRASSRFRGAGGARTPMSML